MQHIIGTQKEKPTMPDEIASRYFCDKIGKKGHLVLLIKG
jgi:hypothetical protein